MSSSFSQAVNSTHPPRAQPPHRDSSTAVSPARHPARSPPPPVPNRASRTSRATAVVSCCRCRAAPLPQGCALPLLSRTPRTTAVVPCRSLPCNAAAPSLPCSRRSGHRHATASPSHHRTPSPSAALYSI
ncbi:hypothetical protein GUJ93_ZPchr0010g8791 [Zizania palustris]|uniref:Uncharacterized protein n=1 Tax=Zizania palustris TaxID=103762 RepID=A0A8J5WHY4_ZIZPA|nr:hypothetical protein GUJ93_ZPchr0010g8791 [Zizania palustris]